MLQQLQIDTAKRRRPLSLAFASNASHLRAAQALRYKVFAEEMGAKLSGREAGLDQDLFDAYCEHLLVQDDETGEVVGTYRILPPHQARKLGSYYADTEFDLTRLQHLRSQFVEVGRSCVHPDYRNGATIALLWSGLADYMQRHGYQYLIGCASMSLADGGHHAASLYRKLVESASAPVEWRVFPRCPLPLAALDQKMPVTVPPLIKGYLRAGAMICGEPAWDPDFNTADLFVLLPMHRIDNRYAKHFLR
ncbi:GNAT family N-acetyltransferase [Chitiniphilus eburneus]|uniref:L-ornithine N(alpha)-acyltransferase n=1 Tax=Chitiniphilus eburneus TaxID=2571148 RepID=A0A4U0PX07_9NEIS|nr:GNAT family N-acyltransferase [Chitiniphilus eburneus]TJZ73091.1 GNAT family N-acetyltransferase [Chitiniphilus eburneus]